jgi:uncharacterized membrane protein YuzA (DUF378 family)
MITSNIVEKAKEGIWIFYILVGIAGLITLAVFLIKLFERISR